MPRLSANELGSLVVNASPPAFWLSMAGAAALAAICAVLAFRFLRRWRLIEDTPTSLIRSAHQGYLELQGKAVWMDGDPIYAPLSARACVWYRYKLEELVDSRDDWALVEQGTSEHLFYIEDATGKCAVDPDGAAVTPTHRDRWYGTSRHPGCLDPDASRWWARLLGAVGAKFRYAHHGQSYRYSEQRIECNATVYALGEFNTHGGAAVRVDFQGAVGDRLRAWKRDRRFMLREFDANKDGDIDPAEWEAARARAAREVEREQDAHGSPPAVDLLSRPRGSRLPFVIASGTEDQAIAYSRKRTVLLFLAGAVVFCLVIWSMTLRLTAGH